MVRDSAVIRILDDALVWYPPGSGDAPRPLDGPEAVAQLAAAAGHGGHGKGLVFAAPAADIALRAVSFTAAEKRHIARALPYLLEDQFAEEVEGLHFAVRPLSRLSLSAAVCSHARMREWGERLSALSPAPKITQWIPEPLLLPWQPGEICILIEEHAVLARTGPSEGFGIDRALATPALAGLEAETVIVYGMNQDADQALLPPALRRRMQWRTGGFGAALMLSDGDKRPLDLLQGEYGPRLPLGDWWRQWRVAAAFLGAAFCLHLAATWAGYERLAAVNLDLRRGLQAAYREAVPQGAMTDPERQLRRKLAAARGDAGSGASFTAVMDLAGRALREQEGARLRSVAFSDRLGEARFTVILPDFRDVEALRERMEEQGLEAVMENSAAEGGMVRARIKARLPSVIPLISGNPVNPSPANRHRKPAR